MSNSERVERLARVLAEHECWKHPGCNETYRDHRAVISNVTTPWLERSLSPAGRAVLAAVREVESGDVYGAPDRCCVCGRCGAQEYFPVLLPHWFRCTNSDCIKAWETMRKERKGDTVVNPDGLIGVILRVRKLYRDAQKAKPKPSDWREKWAERAWLGAVVAGCFQAAGQTRILREWRGKFHNQGKPRPQASTVSTAKQAEVKPTPSVSFSAHRGDGVPLNSRHDERCTTCAHVAVMPWLPPCCHCPAFEHWEPKPTPAQTPERGKAVICKTCAHHNNRCPKEIALPMPTCWKSDGLDGMRALLATHSIRFDTHIPHYSGGENPYRAGRTSPPCPCYPTPREPVSGNPRGDDWLREVWRKEEARTEALRRIAEPHPPGIVVTDNGKCSIRCPQFIHRTGQSWGQCRLLPYAASSVYPDGCGHPADPCPVESIRRAVDCKTNEALHSEVDSIRAGQVAELERIRKAEGLIDVLDKGLHALEQHVKYLYPEGALVIPVLRTRYEDHSQAMAKPKRARKGGKR